MDWHHGMSEKRRYCREPEISLHSYTVPLVQWSTRLLPIMRDPGAIPRGILVWNWDSRVSVVLLQYQNGRRADRDHLWNDCPPSVENKIRFPTFDKCSVHILVTLSPLRDHSGLGLPLRPRANSALINKPYISLQMLLRNVGIFGVCSIFLRVDRSIN